MKVIQIFALTIISAMNVMIYSWRSQEYPVDKKILTHLRSQPRNEIKQINLILKSFR